MIPSKLVAYLINMILCMTCYQVLLKFSAQYAASHPGIVEGFMLNFWLWLALAAVTVGTVSWLLALRDLPLSIAYPWTALVYVLTPLAGAIFFTETLAVSYFLGIGCIMIGVVLTIRGTES